MTLKVPSQAHAMQCKTPLAIYHTDAKHAIRDACSLAIIQNIKYSFQAIDKAARGYHTLVPPFSTHLSPNAKSSQPDERPSLA